MNSLIVPFDDEILAHVANYWAFDDWGESDYDRAAVEAAHLVLGVDSGACLPAC